MRRRREERILSLLIGNRQRPVSQELQRMTAPRRPTTRGPRLREETPSRAQILVRSSSFKKLPNRQEKSSSNFLPVREFRATQTDEKSCCGPRPKDQILIE
jgi:hypothetical protein